MYTTANIRAIPVTSGNGWHLMTKTIHANKLTDFASEQETDVPCRVFGGSILTDQSHHKCNKKTVSTASFKLTLNIEGNINNIINNFE